MGTRRWLFLLLVSLFAGRAAAGVVWRDRQDGALPTRLAAAQQPRRDTPWFRRAISDRRIGGQNDAEAPLRSRRCG